MKKNIILSRKLFCLKFPEYEKMRRKDIAQFEVLYSEWKNFYKNKFLYNIIKEY